MNRQCASPAVAPLHRTSTTLAHTVAPHGAPARGSAGTCLHSDNRLLSAFDEVRARKMSCSSSASSLPAHARNAVRRKHPCSSLRARATHARTSWRLGRHRLPRAAAPSASLLHASASLLQSTGRGDSGEDDAHEVNDFFFPTNNL